MARGWESKSVASQQEDASRRDGPRRDLGERGRAREERRQTLRLSRARTEALLRVVKTDAQRASVVQALEALDRELEAIGTG